LGPKELKSARALDAQWMIIKNKQKEPKDGDAFGIFQRCDRSEITSVVTPLGYISMPTTTLSPPSYLLLQTQG